MVLKLCHGHIRFRTLSCHDLTYTLKRRTLLISMAACSPAASPRWWTAVCGGGAEAQSSSQLDLILSQPDVRLKKAHIAHQRGSLVASSLSQLVKRGLRGRDCRDAGEQRQARGGSGSSEAGWTQRPGSGRACAGCPCTATWSGAAWLHHCARQMVSAQSVSRIHFYMTGQGLGVLAQVVNVHQHGVVLHSSTAAVARPC